MRNVKRNIGLGLLVVLILLLVAGCGRPPEVEPTAVPAPSTPVDETPNADIEPTDTSTPAEPTDTPTSKTTPTDTPVPISETDLDGALQVVRDFLAGLAQGEYRDVYGSLLTTVGQQQLADLVLGRLALTNPHISYFELLGAEPAGDRIAVDVVWQETYEGQGDVGTQEATVYLARQDGVFLVEDVELGDYQPAATPIPPPLPRAEALTSPAIAGQEMRFRGSGFEGGETILTWLELPDGSQVVPGLERTDEDGVFELSYPADATAGLQAGRWIWWAQALRDSTRNSGITFEVEVAPTPTATPTEVPTQPRPTATRPPAQPTAAPTAAPTDTPAPSAAYGAPVALWPEPVTSRDYGSALVVEFVPVADELAPDEFYELVLVASDAVGNVYNAGSVRGKGGACDGQYSQPCRQLIGDERFMELFHPDGTEGTGTWYVQVVKQTGPDQFTPVSPPSEPRTVILKPR
jgi:hypothetical protein